MFVVLVLELLEPENCVRIVTFSFKKKYFRIRTLQLKKSKLSDNLTEDYCWSKHIE